jgi:hypothetical protein
VPTPELATFLEEASIGAWDDRIAELHDSSDNTPKLTTFFDASKKAVWRSFEFSMLLAVPERGADGVERLTAS